MAVDASEALQSGLRLAGWSSWDLWLAMFALGGNLSTGDIDLMTTGHQSPSYREYGYLATAINERFDDLALDHLMLRWDDLPGA